MIILEFQVENWCQHQSVKFSTSQPVVGIFGKNGKGKTNLLAALKYLFTGLLEKEGARYVRHGCKKTKVYAKFMQHGKLGEITRSITKSGTVTRSLVWGDSKEPITAAKEIDAIMSEILGADRQAVDNAVFIPQGMVQQILFGNTTDKEILFTRIVNVARLEKFVGVIDSRIKQESEAYEDLGVFLDELRSQAQAARTEEERTRAEHAAMPDVQLELAQARDCNSAVVAEASAKVNLESANQAKGVTLAALDSELRQAGLSSPEELAASLAKSTADRDELYRSNHEQQQTKNLRDVRKLNQENYQRAAAREAAVHQQLIRVCELANNDNIPSLQGAVDALENRARLQNRVTDLQASFDAKQRAQAILAAAPVNHKERIAVLAADKEKVTGEGSNLKQVLDVLSPIINHSVSGCSCPVCSQAIDPLLISKQRYAKVEEDYKAAQRRYSELHKEQTKLEAEQYAYDTAASAASSALLAAMRDLADAKKNLSSLPEGNLPEAREKLTQAKGRAETITRLRQEKAAAQAEVVQADRSLLLKQGELERINAFDDKAAEDIAARLNKAVETVKSLQDLKNVLDARNTNYVNASATAAAALAAYNAASARLRQLPAGVTVDQLPGLIASLEEKERQRSEAFGRFNQAVLNVSAINTRVRETEARALRAERQKALVSNLRLLRDTLSRSGLPMTYVEYQFQKLAPLTQYQLGRLGASFSVEPHPEKKLCFRYIKPTTADAQYEDMDSMSGGERARLSIAFLMAVQQLLIPDVGLLVLDEPSTHVDEEGKEAMRDLFIGASSDLQNACHQIWMVDHDPILQKAAGAVLEVS